MQVTRKAKIKSLQTMRNTIEEKSSPTTATSSGQDVQAHVAQSEGDITPPIRPRGEANVGPAKAVQPSSRPIRLPRTPQPRSARHQRDPTATPSTSHMCLFFDAMLFFLYRRSRNSLNPDQSTILGDAQRSRGNFS